MKAAIILLILGVYLVLAFIIARLCAVNAGWERIARVIPGNGEKNGIGPGNGPVRRNPDFPGAAKSNG